MNTLKPDVACWRITSRCNRACPFCYRSYASDLPTNEIYKIIDKLKKSGFKAIGITGGEPLLRKDIIPILKYLKRKNFSVCLATNSDYFRRYKKTIFSTVEAIGFPLEGSTAKKHDSVRGAGNFKAVITALHYVTKRPRTRFYLETVVTRNNYADLPAIEKLISPYKQKLIYWKIYEIVNYPDRKKQRIKKLLINDKTIKPVIDSLGKLLGKEKIFYMPAKRRCQASFLIDPNGEVIIPLEKNSKTKDYSAGNLLAENTTRIINNWSAKVDYNKYRCHLCALKYHANI